MKKFYTFIFIIVCSASIVLSQVDPLTKNLQSVINNLQQKYAPDKRTAIFDIKLETTEGKAEGKYVLTGETNSNKAISELEGIIKNNKRVMNEIELLPAKSLGELIYGVVNLSVANLRSKPKHPAELATQSLLGTPLKIYKKRGGFFLVQTPDDYIAWMDNEGFVPLNHSQLEDWVNSKKIIYLNDYGFSFSEPSVKSQRVSDLVIGDLLKYLDDENTFFKVEYPDGRIAFVEKSFSMPYKKWLNITKPENKTIVATAKSFMGIPYLWGGTSAKGMDCSGFTKTVYYMNGIVLPRDASQQVLTGELVDTKDGFEKLKPGDLLFFGKKAEDGKKERITHVGIYIGDMEFVHASGKVKINSFDKTEPNFNQYRYNTFIRAKRILTSVDKNGITSLKNNKYYNGE